MAISIKLIEFFSMYLVYILNIEIESFPYSILILP